jgi:hypothetical protein
MPDNNETQPTVTRPNPTPEVAIRSALQAIADQIADGSKLTVSTSVQVLDTSGPVSVTRERVEIARTEISIDGDREVIVPITLEAGDLHVPQAIYDLHERHVAEATAYRKQLLDTLVDFVKTRRLG